MVKSKTKKASTRQNIQKVLTAAYGTAIAHELLTSYDDMANEYATQHWKTAELDAGHFVETARRILQVEHTKTFTPFGKSLPHLNESELQTMARNTAVGDTFAILLPRALFAVYAIRNKRGVGHKGTVKPSEMDAAYILNTAKWILAEIIRVKSNLSPASTLSIIEEIVERQISVLWSWGDITRVLASGIQTKNEVLVLLCGNKDPLSVDDLFRFTEYTNKKMFTDILRDLHKARLIEYSQEKQVCVLTPKGAIEAEKVLLTARF